MEQGPRSREAEWLGRGVGHRQRRQKQNKEPRTGLRSGQGQAHTEPWQPGVEVEAAELRADLVTIRAGGSHTVMGGTAPQSRKSPGIEPSRVPPPLKTSANTPYAQLFRAPLQETPGEWFGAHGRD